MTQYNNSLTIPTLLQQRTEELSSKCSLRFLHNGEIETDSLTFEQLMSWSNEIAIGLSKITKPGDSVILSFPAGLEFIASFYACLKIGIIAIPVAHPSNRKHHWIRVKQITDDCNAVLLLTSESAVSIATKHWSGLQHPPIFGLKHLDTSGEFPKHEVKPTDIAYLQYTSGSTSAPKGVIMTHQNVIHNIMSIESGFSLSASDVIVSWLPHYHDQGLVGIILTGLWVGIPVILMAPVAFLQNPFRWLHAISRYRGTYSGGPNFCYSFCIEKYTEEKCKNLDLSSWKIAFNGAEPVRPDTLDAFADAFSMAGFSASALAPCYGLAEATLAVSLTPTNKSYVRLTVDKASLEQRKWKPSEQGVELVSSGEICGKQIVAIVDPEHLQEVEPYNIGEIWISGPSVSLGYWKNKEQTIKSMGIKLSTYIKKDFLRTGDLGYIHNGELFVVGRIKDVIIIRGRNHYPQDIELTVSQSSEVFRKSGCAAFSCKIDDAPQLIVVQEIERVAMRKFNSTEARRKVVEQIALNHEIKVHQVVFICPVSLPKTSSGKVQRSLTKKMYIEGTLNEVTENKINSKSIVFTNKSKLGNIVSEILGETVDLNLSLISLGFDSIELIRFKQEVESRLSATLPLELLFENHSIYELEGKLQNYQKISKAIEPPQITKTDNFRMAENQKSLWLAQRMQPHSGAFNLAVPFTLHGTLDKGTLNSAWKTCLERHPLLAMSIKSSDESVMLIPVKQLNKINFHEQTITWNSDNIAVEIRQLAQCPPNLQEPELAALHCWQKDASIRVFSFIIHHVLVDMWSLLNLLDEFLQLVSGKFLSNTPAAYTEYVAQLHRKNQQTEVGLNYWKKKFQNTKPQVLRLPGNPMRPEKRTGHAGSVYFNIGISETNALRSIAKQQNSTLHTLLLAIYGMVLMRFSDQSEVNIGGPTFGRDDPRFNATIGFFVNTVVYQLKQEASLSFIKYLQNVKDETRKVVQHQHTPFSEVVKITGIPSCPGIHPLYQTSFTLQKSHRLAGATPMIINGPYSRSFSVYGQEVSTFPMPQHSCQVDIALTMVDCEGILEGRLDFSTDVLRSRLAEELASSIEQVICHLPNQMLGTISEIPIQKTSSPITEGSTHLRSLKNFIPVNQTLHESMQTYANQVAFIYRNETFKYQQLAFWTARIAGHLKRLNVSHGEVVALACSRSPYWVSTMLAIWQVGAIYVPIDDNLPEKRVKYILDQVSPQLVLVEDGRLDFFTEKVDIKQLLNEEVEDVACANISSEDSAYIIFTSGTTGLPKGAIVNHGSMSNRLEWLAKKIPLIKAERVLHKTPISFDVSLWECLWPLYSGAISVIADDIERKSPSKLVDLMRAQKITTAQFVPSFLSVFCDFIKSDWPKELTRIICGGETLKPDLVERLGLNSGLELHNLYGPTETGFVTHKQIIHPLDTLSLGKAIGDTEVMILDSDDRPTPLGVKGEIVVIGKAVGLGYLNQTRVGNKFGVNNTGVRYYRTGDTAEYLEQGEIKFLGRTDRQVKLRGFRIELSEIESVLLKHPKVIAAYCSKVGEGALGQLLVWVHSINLDLAETLVELCKQTLPTYMCPDRIFVLEKWPLTAHGKLNIQMLPMDINNYQAQNEPPLGYLENTLAEIWSSVLNQNLIYRETNFLSAGGHSLLAFIMAGRVREKFGISPDIQLIFREPTLKKYAQNLIKKYPNVFASESECIQEKEEFLI